MSYPPAIYKFYVDGDSVGATDLNAIQTLMGQTNLTPSNIDDSSASIGAMQTTVDPYPSGVESLAGNLAEELQRLRYMFSKVLGLTQWYKYTDAFAFGPGDASGTNTAGANNAIQAGSGTGSGIGGNVLVKVAYPGSSGTSVNSKSTVATISGSNKQSSGAVDLVSFTPTVNQSGTAGYSALKVNTTETATGTGTKNLLQLQVGSSDKFVIDSQGIVRTGAWTASPVGAGYGGTGLDGSIAGNGGLLIGNGSCYTLNYLTAGTGISVSNGVGSIVISATATPSTTIFAETFTGLTLSNDGTTPNTVLDVAAGACSSDDAMITDRVLIMPSALTGTTGGTWVVGTGQPKLDTGSVATNTWYHVFAIKRTDTNVSDIVFSTSATSPTMPTSYTKKRRIGAFKTDGSGNIKTFSQEGDEFLWLSPVLDVSAASLSTSAVLYTLSVPLGVKVQAIVQPSISAVVSGNPVVYLSSPDVTDLAPSNTSSPLATIGTTGAGTAANGSHGRYVIRTDTSSRIRCRADADNTFHLATLGWWDRRGRG